MKPSLFALIAGLAIWSPESQATHSIEILCGTAVGFRYRSEVELPNAPDKYKHCSLSCVITLYCGPAESMETGILKEVYDALGFGDPDIEDLRADLRGIRTALRFRGSMTREDCYRACSLEYPIPGLSPALGR
jgi:hypothetical protein